MFQGDSVVLEFGELEGKPELLFGYIEDLAVARDGRIFVLDSRFSVIRVFAPNGAFLTEGGRPGRGPGELTQPVALAMDSFERLLVLDAANGRFSAFAANRSLTHVFSAALNFPAWDMCTVGNRAYVRGLSNDRLVHEFRVEPTSAQYVRSFAEPTTGHPVVRQLSGRGFIACMPRAGLVITTGIDDGVLRAYSLDGDLRWTVSLDRYRRVLAVPQEGGAVLFRPPDSRDPWHHITLGLTPLSDGTVLAQLGSMYPRARERDDVRTLEGRAVTSLGEESQQLRMDMKYLVVRDRRRYGVTNHPYPRVRVISHEPP